MYYYSSAATVTTAAGASTNKLIADLKTASATAGLRAYVQKLLCGHFQTPADNDIWVELIRFSALAGYSSGSSITPAPMVTDAPAAASLASTTPTIGTSTLATVPCVQLGYNQRGTAWWAAFTPDEAVGISGSNSAVGGIVVLNTQSTGTSVPVVYNMLHSE